MGIYEKALEIQTKVDQIKTNLKLDATAPLSEVVAATASGGGGKYAPRYTYQPIKFRAYKGTELDQETTMLDTTYFTNLSSMFENCSNLISLDLSGWNTSNTTNMSYMFYGCMQLTSLDLSGFDTSKVTDMNAMFTNCMAITLLDLSSFDTSKVTNMSMMFTNCMALNFLDIRNFTFDSVTSYSGMFQNVSSDCLVIVKSETEKQWILTNGYSNFTNIKTVAEYEAS